jgi:hypothetical protein
MKKINEATKVLERIKSIIFEAAGDVDYQGFKIIDDIGGYEILELDTSGQYGGKYVPHNGVKYNTLDDAKKYIDSWWNSTENRWASGK